MKNYAMVSERWMELRLFRRNEDRVSWESGRVALMQGSKLDKFLGSSRRPRVESGMRDLKIPQLIYPGQNRPLQLPGITEQMVLVMFQVPFQCGWYHLQSKTSQPFPFPSAVAWRSAPGEST